MNKIKYITAVLVAVTGLCLQQAKADTFTSSLEIANSSLSGLLSPGEQFGTVTVTLTSSTTATITFTSNVSGGFFFIDTSAADVQLSSGTTLASPSGIVDAAFKDFGSGKTVNGFGAFNLEVNNNDGTGSEVSLISFNVTGTFSSAADVLTTNLQGFDAAAHISTTINGTTLTGFVAEAPGAFHVPDGGMTAMLLGLGLSGLGLVRRFVKR